MTDIVVINNSCGKVKNPCKICLQPTTRKNGLQCQGACKKWVHFDCVGYTPGKISDIKKGILKVLCPCPDCHTKGPKEVLVKPPLNCNIEDCPASKPPTCTVPNCPSNIIAKPIPPPLTGTDKKSPPSSTDNEKDKCLASTNCCTKTSCSANRSKDNLQLDFKPDKQKHKWRKSKKKEKACPVTEPPDPCKTDCSAECSISGDDNDNDENCCYLDGKDSRIKICEESKKIKNSCTCKDTTDDKKRRQANQCPSLSNIQGICLSDCRGSCSDSQVGTNCGLKDDASLMLALQDMCSTVGTLSTKLKCLIDKLGKNK